MQIKEAKERAEEIRGFYIHIIIFVMVNLFLLLTDMISSFSPAIYLAIAGWFVGLLIHGLITFVLNGLLGKKWEENKIKLLAEKKK